MWHEEDVSLMSCYFRISYRNLFHRLLSVTWNCHFSFSWLEMRDDQKTRSHDLFNWSLVFFLPFLTHYMFTWTLRQSNWTLRPGRTGVGATGRGVLSMSALSHGVIRVDQENSLTSLTLQDCGHILPGGKFFCQLLNVLLCDFLCCCFSVGAIREAEMWPKNTTRIRFSLWFRLLKSKSHFVQSSLFFPPPFAFLILYICCMLSF